MENTVLDHLARMTNPLHQSGQTHVSDNIRHKVRIRHKTTGKASTLDHQHDFWNIQATLKRINFGQIFLEQAVELESL